MHIWAKKTDYERQQEEDERLVRPSPKDKPPRRDLRRERVQPDVDPDADDSSDKKDRSKNYKNVGGSVAERWAASDERVPAKSRETGRTVMVSPETLKNEPGKYELVEHEDEERGKEPPSPEKGEPKEKADKGKLDKQQFYGKAGDALHALAKDNPKLQSKLKGFTSPEADLYGFVRENPDFPASKVFPGVDLPKGLNTLGDVKQALEAAANRKKPKDKKKPPAATPTQEPASQEPKPEEPSTEAPKQETQEPSEETPEGKPKSEKPKKPKKDKDEKSESGEEPEEAPQEPTESEKAGVAPPKRRAVTAMEREEALSLLVDTFPPGTVAKLVARDIHPDDVKTLVRDYTAAKKGARVGNLEDFASKVSGFYSESPDSVKPPSVGTNKAGQTVPFDKLTPEEQSEATRQHQLRVTAMSLAARDVLTSKIMDTRAISGRPRVPHDVAQSIAQALFNPSTDEGLSAKEFDRFIQSGQVNKIDEKSAQRLIDKVRDNPTALAVARAYLQANDYGLAKDKFLKGDDESISEWQDPRDIVKGLKRAGEFFNQRNGIYGDANPHPSAAFFRMKVLKRLRALDPKKAKAVTEALPELEQEEFEERHADWKKQTAEWEKRKAEHAKKFEKWEADNKAWTERKAEYDKAKEAYDANPKSDENPEGLDPPKEFKEKEPRNPGKFSEDAPVEPPAPTQADKKSGAQLWKAVFKAQPKRAEPKPEPNEQDEVEVDTSDYDAGDDSARTKKAGDFTYPAALVMGSAGKLGVYHGVDPYAYGSAAYPGWLQPHQRDLGEGDFASLLSGAKSWLSSPLLSVAIEGMNPDARYRAALDMAIYDGPYNGQIQPNQYNRLLADLAGVPEPAQGETLLTIQEKHSYELERADLKLSAPATDSVLAAIRTASFAYEDSAGVPRKNGHLAIRGCQGDTVSVDFPAGSAGNALEAAKTVLASMQLTVEVTSKQYGNSTFATGSSMNASNQIRRFAAQVTNSKLAFEMLAFADRLAEEEKKGLPPWLEKKVKDDDKDEGQKKEASNKYATLKATVIKHAASLDAGARQTLLPILQAIKNLG